MTERKPPSAGELAFFPAAESVQATAEAPAFGDEIVVSTSLAQRTVSGVLWSGGSRLAQQLVQFATSVVLARLLVPEDFGLVAQVLVFTSFAWVLVDFGFSAALIQRENLEERHVVCAFWLNVAVGTLLTVITIGISPALAAFYHEPRLANLTIAMSAAFALGSLGIVQGTLLERDLNFRRLAIITNAATAAGGIAGIGAAVSGLGVWSVVIEGLVVTGLRSVLLWVTSDWRPALSIDPKAVRELWSFSSNLAAFNAVNFWARNADNLLIGRFVSPASLGIYSRAYSLMMVPLNQVTSTVSVAMYPALARLQRDQARLRAAYLQLAGIVAFVSFPLATGLFVTARPFVLTLYGTRWSDVATVLQILCVPLLVQSVGSTVGLIYQACGRTDWLFRWGIVASGATVAAFAIGIHWGVHGVAAAYAIVSVPLFYFSLLLPGRLIGVRFGDLWRFVRAPLAAAIAMAALSWGAGRVVAPFGNAVELSTEVIVGIVTYTGIARAWSLSAFLELRSIYRERRANQLFRN